MEYFSVSFQTQVTYTHASPARAHLYIHTNVKNCLLSIIGMLFSRCIFLFLLYNTTTVCNLEFWNNTFWREEFCLVTPFVYYRLLFLIHIGNWWENNNTNTVYVERCLISYLTIHLFWWRAANSPLLLTNISFSSII